MGIPGLYPRKLKRYDGRGDLHFITFSVRRSPPKKKENKGLAALLNECKGKMRRGGLGRAKATPLQLGRKVFLLLGSIGGAGEKA